MSACCSVLGCLFSLDNHPSSLQAKLQDALAERDTNVAQMGSEVQRARKEAERVQTEMLRMEGVVRATGERAAVRLTSL